MAVQAMQDGLNGVECPYCGRPALSREDPPCEHLIADFGDGSKGDRGIMSGQDSRSGNAALQCLGPLEAALKGLQEIAGPGPGEEMSEEEQAALAKVLYGVGQVQEWWNKVMEEMRIGAVGDYTVGAIWRQVVPLGEKLQEVRVSVGEMNPSLVSFVWAQDPAEGRQAMENSVAAVTEEIEIAGKRLAMRGWVSWT